MVASTHLTPPAASHARCCVRGRGDHASQSHQGTYVTTDVHTTPLKRNRRARIPTTHKRIQNPTGPHRRPRRQHARPTRCTAVNLPSLKKPVATTVAALLHIVRLHQPGLMVERSAVQPQPNTHAACQRGPAPFCLCASQGHARMA